MVDRAIFISPDVTILDCVTDSIVGATKPTPEDAFSAGLGALLSRVAPRFDPHGEGVVVIAAEAAEALHLPAEGDQDGAAALVADLGRAGWRCGRVSDWTTVYANDRPKLHVANLARVKPADFPLAPTGALNLMTAMDLVVRLKLWHELTGYAWRLTPAASGLAIMSGLDKQRVIRGKHATGFVWKNVDDNGEVRPEGPCNGEHEDDYRKKYWSRKPTRPQPFAQCMDAVRSYIAAAMCTDVSPEPLEHTGKIEFDKRRAGWWYVELAEWGVKELPNPAGYIQLKGPKDPKRVIRPITTPTMVLLEELRERGVYAGARVIDSWTGPARDYPLKPYARRLNDAYNLRTEGTRGELVPMRFGALVEENDVDAVQSALKIVGHKTFGALDDASNWAYRSHVWHSILATARANLWRKCRDVGEHTGNWPLWIEVDAVWYGTDSEDPYETARSLQYDTPSGPRGILLDPQGLQLGRFRPKGTLRLKERRP